MNKKHKYRYKYVCLYSYTYAKCGTNCQCCTIATVISKAMREMNPPSHRWYDISAQETSFSLSRLTKEILNIVGD